MDLMSHLEVNPASYRDPSSRVYEGGGVLLRGLNETAAAHYTAATQETFFQQWMADGKMVPSTVAADDWAAEVLRDGWSMVLAHERLPFISYPYEWTFHMLKDAALLHLHMQEEAMMAGWTLKDATAFNVQWRGVSPMLIDIPSLIPRAAGVPWAAYRQFCMNFLYPLMLRAHLGIDFTPLLRADLEGIAPPAMAHYFYGLRCLRRGVLTHVIFPAAVEKSTAQRRRKRQQKTQAEAVTLGLVRGVINLTEKLSIAEDKTVWLDYEREHSYNDTDFAAKKEFVAMAAQEKRRKMVWDLGCNTGIFSHLCAAHSDTVLAVDGDAGAVDRLYRRLKNDGSGGNILPLVLNMANLSPAQGWAGRERMAFDQRTRPNLVLCLALIHHLRITNGIPLPMFLDWLRGLGADVVIEFVDRQDEMTQQLLQAKTETYDDYNMPAFESAVAERFAVQATRELKNGTRKLYFLRPL